MNIMAISSKDIICLSNGMRIDHHKLPNYMDMRGGYEYNQTENPYIQETPVFTGALAHCHRDWMLTAVKLLFCVSVMMTIFPLRIWQDIRTQKPRELSYHIGSLHVLQ